LFTSWIAVRMASLSDRLFREKVRYTRPARTLIVASSHPASNNASWTSGVNSVIPDRTKAKSCSHSHSIPGFVFIILLRVPLFLLAVGAHVYFPPDVTGVILWVSRGWPHGYNAAFPCAPRTQKAAPGVPQGQFDTPTQRFRVLDRLFDMLVGVSGPAHPPNPIPC